MAVGLFLMLMAAGFFLTFDAAEPAAGFFLTLELGGRWLPTRSIKASSWHQAINKCERTELIEQINGYEQSTNCVLDDPACGQKLQ
jgi:hypothetical protein